MALNLFRKVSQLQVLYAVIGIVAVDVVDNLGALKFATKMFFHNKTVLEYFLSPGEP